MYNYYVFIAIWNKFLLNLFLPMEWQNKKIFKYIKFTVLVILLLNTNLDFQGKGKV